MNNMKIKATFQQEVYIDPAEAFEQIKAHLGFAPYRAFVMIKDGELVRGEDVSHHGTPDYEYEIISNNPKWLELYKSVQCLDDYFQHSQEPQWQRRIERKIEENMDNYDKAALAIRDGELETFKTLLPDLQDKAESLFIQAAGRPGTIGRKMTMLMLDKHHTLPLPSYRLACKKAIDTGDTVRVDFLLDQAPAYVGKLPLGFYGELAYYAYSYHENITNQIIDRCTPEQVEQFPAKLLHNAILRSDLTTPWKLVQKGINGDKCIVDIIDFCARTRKEGKVRQLLQEGLKISAENFPALWACIQHRFTDCAKLLLENGMDFDAFKQWASERRIDLVQIKSYRQIEYWNTVRNSQQDSGMQMS